MGFWHTGYFEFHEEAGLENVFQLEKATYRCQHCTSEFDSMDELRRHRFESHSYTRPLLCVRGIELGATVFRVTRKAEPLDFNVERSTKAMFNGNSVRPTELPKLLAKVINDKVKVELINEGAHAVFNLVFRIASDEHLVSVEAAFLKLAKKGILTISTIESFIEDCKTFETADGYYNGICHYLYGVLAKERAPDSSLPYDEYRDRFNRAADALMDYDRPLARIVRGLVAFHFNHFADAAAFPPAGRLRRVAQRFSLALDGKSWKARLPDSSKKSSAPEDLLTDHETLRILRWGELHAEELADSVEQISALVKRDIPEFDRLKLKILLAEASTGSGKTEIASKIARELISNSRTAHWAEHMLVRLSSMENKA